MSAPAVAVRGEEAEVVFDRFDLDAYRTFLDIKRLPESRVSFDWEADAYTVTTAARFADRIGGAVPPSVAPPAAADLAPHLFDYQRWAVAQALAAKRFALWLDTGLGKTACYLEWARQVSRRTGGGKVLILAPLAVLRQVADEARRFYGGTCSPRTLPTREALEGWLAGGPEQPPLALCNYEKFVAGEVADLRLLAGLVADESSLLKTGGGVIRWNLIKSARGIEYKLSCTATPAPNDAMEYASQAAFLEKLRTEGEILWTFFHKDGKGNWSVKPHAKQAFYAFMASWSVYLRDPARFGFGDVLAGLPDPVVTEERIAPTDEQRREMTALLARSGKGLFADDRLGVTERTKLAQMARGFVYETAGGKRTWRPIDSRKPDRVAEWVRGEVASGRPTLVWTAFDAEALLLVAHLGDVPKLTLHGEMDGDERAEALDRFRAGDVAVLVSKPQLIGYGLNLQFVKSMCFSGFDDSFERMYQAVRRAHRFGQTDAVRVFVPYVPELEGLVFANVRQKEARFLAEVAAQEDLYRAALGMGKGASA